MTYPEFKIKAELSGFNPVPESIFDKFCALYLEDELFKGLWWNKENKFYPDDTFDETILKMVFSVVISRMVSSGKTSTTT